MRDLYHFALARKHSLMFYMGRESDDPRCRRSRVRTDYEYDLSTPGSQSLAAEDLGHGLRLDDSTASHKRDYAPTSVYQQGLSSNPDSCLLLEPPTTRERFRRIEAALNEVKAPGKDAARKGGSMTELHPNLLLRTPTTRARNNRIESAITDTLNQSTHQLRRLPSYDNLGSGQIIRGRDNRRRSASTNTLLKRRLPAVLPSTGDDNGASGSATVPPEKKSQPDPKPQPRPATTNESRHLSRDLIELLSSDDIDIQAIKRAKRPLPKRRVTPPDLRATNDIKGRSSSEPPNSGSVTSHRPSFVYRLPPVLLDNEDDIFRSQAALQQVLEEAKRSVERQIYEESQIPPRREESAIHSPKPQRAVKRPAVSLDNMEVANHNRTTSQTILPRAIDRVTRS